MRLAQKSAVWESAFLLHRGVECSLRSTSCLMLSRTHIILSMEEYCKY